MEFVPLYFRARFFTRTNDNCGMIGDRKVLLVLGGKAEAGVKCLPRASVALGIVEVSMIVAALVMMALAQAPAGSATLSGQVVDAEGRPAVGVEVLLSGLGRRTGTAGAFAGEVRSGGAVPDRRSRRKGSRAGSFSPGALGLRPEGGARRAGVLAVSAPGGGFGATEAGRPGAHGGSSGRDLMESRWPARGWRRCWCAWPEGFGPGRRSRRPTRSPTCSRPRPTPTARAKSRAVEPRTSRRSGSRPPGSVAREANSAAAAGGDPVITLKPAGRLTGRVQADDPSAARGLEVIAMTQPQAAGRPTSVGRGPRDNRCRGPLRDPGPGRRQARTQRVSGRWHRSFDPSFPPTSRSSPARPPKSRSRWRAPARADGGGPGGRPRRPARRRRHRVPVRRFPGADRSRDRRGWAIRIERCRRAADVPVRPEAGLPLRRPRHRARVSRRDARDPQGGRAAPAHAENASAPVAPPGRTRAGAPPARPLRGARSQTGGRGGEGAHARSTRAHRARARARADRRRRCSMSHSSTA